MPRKLISLERRLNRHARTILICGIFFTLAILIMLTFCKVPCEDSTYALLHEDRHDAEGNSFWNKHLFEPVKQFSAFLVVVVISAPKHEDKRNLIRETWGRKVSGVMLKFVIGTAGLDEKQRETILTEKKRLNDMILLDKLDESYQSLTAKLLNTFAWLDKNVNFNYVFKADEDTFARASLLVEELNSGKMPSVRLYWGFFDGRAHVKKRGKWAEKDWILCDRYLPYALGGGYVLSSDLVHYVVINSAFLKSFNSEDVSLGTWLGPLDINRIHDPRFNTEFYSRGCSNKYLVTHKQSAQQIRDLHQNLEEKGQPCWPEVKLRKSYIYNWNELPTQCCIRNNTEVP